MIDLETFKTKLSNEISLIPKGGGRKYKHYTKYNKRSTASSIVACNHTLDKTKMNKLLHQETCGGVLFNVLLVRKTDRHM